MFSSSLVVLLKIWVVVSYEPIKSIGLAVLLLLLLSVTKKKLIKQSESYAGRRHRNWKNVDHGL
jgi:hypothetical protein